MSAKFEVGKTYSTGEGRDYVWRFTVVKRTPKVITIVDANPVTEADKAPKRVGVTIGFNGHEIALPLGRYSMAPVINADMPYEPEPEPRDALYGLGLKAVAL